MSRYVLLSHEKIKCFCTYKIKLKNHEEINALKLDGPRVVRKLFVYYTHIFIRKQGRRKMENKLLFFNEKRLHYEN